MSRCIDTTVLESSEAIAERLYEDSKPRPAQVFIDGNEVKDAIEYKLAKLVFAISVPHIGVMLKLTDDPNKAIVIGIPTAVQAQDVADQIKTALKKIIMDLV